MTENERKVLTLLSVLGPLSKRDICRHSRLAWATVSKMVTRLHRLGLVEQAGLSPHYTAGKNAYLYRLSSTRPLAVGVDVEYGTTRMVIINLRDEVIAETSIPTPRETNVDRFADELSRAIEAFVSASPVAREELSGVGIGVARWLLDDEPDLFPRIRSRIAEALGMRVEVVNNIGAYVASAVRDPAMPDTFVLVTVRSGIGAGIVLGGIHYTGEDDLAGEISHLRVCPEENERCRCGNYGCLETCVNENILRERSRELFGNREGLGDPLPRLFSHAANGDRAAIEVLDEAARPLAEATSSLVLVLNVREIYLLGHFGPDGEVLARAVQRRTAETVYRRTRFRVAYRPLEDGQFLAGAAHLVLNDFCDFSVPLQSREEADETTAHGESAERPSPVAPLPTAPSPSHD